MAASRFLYSVDVHYEMNTLKAESANPTLLTLNGLRAIVA
jgi:hypothetical protein